jgi:uncharacterized membrane protein YebE (DUF533 family)
MSLGNILGQMLQQGISGQQTTQNRLGTTTGNIAQQGQGVDQLLAKLQSMLGGATGGGTASAGTNPMANFAEAAKAFLGGKQAAGMSGAQIGGLGALAGAVLGGGSVKGAARGGAMAILGTLALNALNKSKAGGGTASAGAIDDATIDSVASEEGERLALRAMIAAAKADGQIDQSEMDRILGKLEPGDVTAEERAFVMDEIRAPLDPAVIARDVRTPAQAAEVYAASLLAIDVDSDAERAYLRELAAALKLEPAAVAYLHQTTGAPTA